MSIDLYNHLTVFGSFYATKHKMEDTKNFVEWTEENYNYVKYNPRKNINREGLSITSLDGKLSGIPDLDSLLEYNSENNTMYREKDFRTPTPVYYWQSLKNLLDPIKDDIFRSHILKINSGGYFPPHRDFYGMRVDCFRIIIPLINCDPPHFTFLLEDKILSWTEGHMYFLDTAKMHYLFNTNSNPAYMIVLNVDLNKHSIDYIIENIRYQ
jgi:hypothetical protein